ncbi:putative metal-dependent phosphoesterases (PHP family) [Candidatus Syntrophocurvum alkaliphilum]|uniref:Putative metal-dependent phosphoesterases (PHP family) n=1 Tax=Candidatus Syntrophocurvum alkaliphilum TaxID=2293317 RepID=A0A6I6DH49_9FIRM|nr:PHP domain-containing protein [Candidatus Syntrophocurvum alkaliphilum]QGT99633.1 putative metal-dependent phosphoesterases (PHP family) [Candidatus Syntrophocurvum alkaliphilum]
MYYDLHIHTTASDGMFSPEQIIKYSIEFGLFGIAITDHDTIDGLEPALNYNSSTGSKLKFIPGIELNTELNDIEVHILGYFIDYKNQALKNRLQEVRECRYERAQKMINKLRSMGFQITFDYVKQLAQGDLIGRPHVAQALMAKGYVFSLKEAFDKYISKGRAAYVPRYKFTPNEAINLIKQAGGISVLAHPGLIKDQRLINEVVDMGVEGIEAYYPEHSDSQINRFLSFSSEKKLYVTGGSDFHGTSGDESRGRLGCIGVSYDLVKKLYEHKGSIS